MYQFLCALNWMRLSMPAFGVFDGSSVQGRWRQNQTESAKSGIVSSGWNCQQDVCLEDCKQMLAKASFLAHPDPEKSVCVFTDASERHWGAVVTQVSMKTGRSRSKIKTMNPWFF
jgi:hypothetical protein